MMVRWVGCKEGTCQVLFFDEDAAADDGDGDGFCSHFRAGTGFNGLKVSLVGF